MSVVAIGELVVDWLSFKRGETIYTATDFYRALGGCATNVAIGLTRLGTTVRLAACIGADFHGQYLLTALQSEGVDTSFVRQHATQPTGQCYMTTTDTGAHHYHNWPRPNASDMLGQEDISAALLGGASFLHITGISLMGEPRRTAVRQAVEKSRLGGMAFSFDGGFPTDADEQTRSCAQALLQQCDLLKLNEFELNFWAGEQRSQEVAVTARRVFQRYQPLALFVTLAARGCLVVTADDTIACPTYPVSAVSEVGAGDAFVAGSLHQLLQTIDAASPLPSLRSLTAADWRRIGSAANVAGALACRQLSAYGGMPDAQEFASAVGKLPI